MGNKMIPIPFGKLMTWALNEYKAEGTIFGIRKIYKHENCGHQKIFGEKLELPMGPAAGPHTQLAQNIISAYVAGARYFELKTVQKLDGDDLPISKPCINAFDEGYNVEWSTELYVPQALDEYIKGWYAVSLLSRELGLGSSDGFVINMSVGYDLEGIKTEKIDSFIEGLKNAENRDSWKACRDWTLANLSEFSNIDEQFIGSIRRQVSNSITLSTLHGCPPDEIERIAEYLLREKGLHTYIKCNPTLVGYDYARETLDKLGYDYISFDDKHFKNDLQFEDAAPMLKRLQNIADSLNLEFGVKLTNTFPVKCDNTLLGDEMYMSGRALYPLSMEVVRRLSAAFGGNLNISYSGGADASNIADILDTGIRTVTMATTLLKPGGYERLHQIAMSLRSNPLTYHAEYKLYKKQTGLSVSRKINAPLPLTDCYRAPCRDGCPFNQDIPAYLRLMSEGKPLEALRVITERNPLPHITGTICSHNCMNKCTRFYYEESVDIRAVKLEAAQSAYNELMAEIKNLPKDAKTGKHIAIIGGGPAGLSCAYFLSKANYRVTIFEEKSALGGIVRHIIPGFRIDESMIEKDIALIMAMGVDVRLNTKVTSLDTLRDEGFEHIVIAVGAWKPTTLKLQEGSATDALVFLEKLKEEPASVSLGENVVVAGGGNTAMDTARAAIRVSGVKQVTLVYRRTKRYMPADIEELELAINEGVRLIELAAPVSLSGGMLVCNQMKLDKFDTSGRPTAIATGETFAIQCDTLISAIGSKVDDDLIKEVDVNGTPDVYIIGDASRGSATIAEAIADAAKCATDIAGISFDKYAVLNVNTCATESERNKLKDKRGTLYISEKNRCLECATMCNLCVEVCPNRANLCVNTDGHPQIVHIEEMCNECGNCAVFCPYDGAPYLDKPKDKRLLM